MAIYMWREYVVPDCLCFTAEQASSTVRLAKQGSPTDVTIETSTDGITWSSYTIGDTVTLSNIWDKLYMRNTSATTTGFSSGASNYYIFTLGWSLSASGDITSLINKNCTDTLNWEYCFYRLFYNSSSNSVLKTPPEMPATTLTNYCYSSMFFYCNWLTALPKLPATTLANWCYQQMFRYCSNIKLSATQTWSYTQEYRIPTTWTWTEWTYSLQNMFNNTWWTFTWTPTINTTYYTSNQVI